MKTIITALLLSLCTGAVASTYELNLFFDSVFTDKVSEPEHPHILLPTHFAQPFIIDKADLDLLKSSEVYKVELIYTTYKKDINFNQEKLNQERVSELLNLIPNIQKYNPTWNLVAQTGATNSKEANEYFHGFAIYYRTNFISQAIIDEVMSHFTTPEKDYTINNSKAKTIICKSGTKIHIPADAVTYENGDPVKGDYTLSYKEYRNPAEIALSGIPMTFEKNNLNYNFTSKGMYEIRGYKDEIPLKLQKTITIDFNCTEVPDSSSYFVLDDNTNEWSEIAPIVAEIPMESQPSINLLNAESNSSRKKDVDITPHPFKYVREGKIKSATWTHKNSTAIISEMGYTGIICLNEEALKNFKEIKKIDSILKHYKAYFYEDKSTIKVYSGKTEEFAHIILTGENLNPSQSQVINQASQYYYSPGHYFPRLVRGLQANNFGVYNCDQVYRIEEPVTIHPKYYDITNDKLIEVGTVTCVLDLNLNGSFSFSPLEVTLNSKGKNALLLFLPNKKVYLASASSLRNIDYFSENLQLEMIDISEKVKSSDDLLKLISI